MRALPLLALFLVAGCAETACYGIREYQPFVAGIVEPKEVVFAAAVRTVRELGAARIDVAPNELKLDAILSHDWAQKTREHLRLSVSDERLIAIEVRTEMQTEAGEWIVPEKICNDYGFERERKIARQILGERAVLPPPRQPATINESI